MTAETYDDTIRLRQINGAKGAPSITTGHTTKQEEAGWQIIC